MRAASFCRSRVAGNPQSGQERPRSSVMPSTAPGVAPGLGSLLPAARSSSRRSRNNCARIRSRFHMRFGVGIAGGSEARSSVRVGLRLANEAGRGSHDRDAAERIQIEKIFVADFFSITTRSNGTAFSKSSGRATIVL
jgi:hypothetical protein